MNFKTEKQKLRNYALSILSKSNQVIVKEFDLSGVELLLAFVPLKSEPDITPVINYAISSGISVGIPTENPLKFVKIDKEWKKKLVNLPNGTKSIYSVELIDIRNINVKTVILVPGLLFTETGERLGRGAGFYDRILEILEKNPLVHSTGVCTKKQLVEKLPADDNDKRVNNLLIH